MKQYIDKEAVAAEIERLQDSTMDEDSNFYSAKAQAEYDILCVLENSINNIEVEHDTFIEKACEYMRNHIDRQLTIYHERTWKKRDEFIEDFKNYMEVCK